jgi:hypothetical protein
MGVIAASYANTIHSPLLRDSEVIIGVDPRLRELSWHNLVLMFSKSYWWPTFASPAYRPLTTFSFLVNWTLLGDQNNPLGYHLLNIALHMANTVLLFVVARRLAGPSTSSWFPWIASALFAAHPIETEAVTYVVGRSDELVAFAVLGGLLCHLRAAESSGRARIRWLVLLATCAFVGAFSKESGLVLIGVLVLHDALFFWPGLASSLRERVIAGLRSRSAEYLVTLPSIVTLVVARYFAVVRNAPFLGWPFIDNPLVDASLPVRLLTAMKVFVMECGLLFIPYPLSSDYSYDAISLFGSGSALENALCWFGIGNLVVVVVGAFAARRRAPVVAFGLLFFLGTLVPTANVFFVTGSIMAERFLYVPSLGFCLAIAYAIALVTQKFSSRLPELVAPTALVLVFGVATHFRNEAWHDDLALWKSTVKAQPRSAHAHSGLAKALGEQGPDEANLDAAIASAQLAVKIVDSRPLPMEDRDDIFYSQLAHHLRIKAEHLRDRNEEAEADGLLQRAWDLLQRAKEIDVDTNRRMQALLQSQGRADSRPAGVGRHAIYLEIFSTAADLQRWPEATEAVEHARALAPLDPNVHLALARVRLTEGQIEDAAVATLESIILEANDRQAWSQLQMLYSALGENGAIRQSGLRPTFDASVPLVRQHINRACKELIGLLMAVGSRESARVLYQRAIDPSDLAVPPDILGASP